MKEQLIQYGFTEMPNIDWLELTKNDWWFKYCLEDNYMCIYSPASSDDDRIVVCELTYTDTIKLIEFISEYK